MFDSGKDVTLDAAFNPNDSACILKEYLRSLPEPLLTRELYSSFLAMSSEYFCLKKSKERKFVYIRRSLKNLFKYFYSNRIK